MEPPKPEPDNVPNDTPDGAEELRYAKGTPVVIPQWLHSVVENSSDIITIVDPDGALRYASLAFKRVLGYDPKEVVGTMNVLDYVHLDDLPHVLQQTEEALSEGGMVSNHAEYRLRHADGSWRWIESVGTYLLDDPVVGGVLVISRDVTERKEAEEALQKSEEEIFSILESITDAFFALDREWRFTYINSQAEVLFGSRREDLIGERIWEDPTFYPEYRRAVAEGKTARFEAYYPRLEAWYSVRAYPSESGLSVYLQDVTQRKRAEERIRVQARLLDAVGQAVIATDWQGKIIYCNRAAEELYGWSAGEAMGRSGIEATAPENLWGRADEIMSELRAMRSWSGEYELRRKNGTLFHAMITITPVLDEEDNLVGITGVTTDITELRRAEERLREAEERYRTLVEQNPAVTYIDRADGSDEPLYTSPQIEKLLGYTSEEWLEGRLWLERLHPEDRERVLAADERFESGSDESFSEEYRLIAKDGSVVWVREEAVLVRNEESEPLFWQGVIFDITDRKEAEEAIEQLSHRNQLILNSAGEGIYGLDREGKTTFVNPTAAALTGFGPEELIGKSLHGIIHHSHPDGTPYPIEECPIYSVLRDREVHNVDDEVFWRKDGTSFPVEYTRTPIWEDGEVVGAVVTFTDVTERKEAEERLRKSEVRLAEAQRLAHLGGWEWDIKKDEVSWSDELYRIYGLEPQAAVPSLERFMEVVHPDDREHVKTTIEAVLQQHEPYDIEHRLVRPDGEVRVVHRRAEVVRGEDGEPVRMIGTVHDITKRKVLEGQLEHRAFHDLLTGLPNRFLFVDRLGQALRRTGRKKSRQVAVLYMDIDDFKTINDSLGHEVGDDLLKAVAERLWEGLRQEDILARFGGDEFTVLIEELEDPDDAVRVAERMIGMLQGPFNLKGRELFVRPSIGIALGDARTKTAEDLLRDADTAMYRAKEEGSGYEVFDQAMYERVMSRLELENNLRRAIEHEEFVVHYQPIVNLHTGQLWGLEALMRWDHPERGLLNPDQFVSVAEESGLVVPLGEVVLKEACRRTKEWQEEHPGTPSLMISVNLSAKQLQRPDLAEAIESALRESKLDASYLSLDVTESVYVHALEGNSATLDRLTAMGVRISIDDFGMGYSSLSYLKRLPADALKIDKSFIRGLGEDVKDTAIVRMVIELAHTLGMEVIAEGVESWDQAALLEEIGCDLGQGYHFSKPLLPDELQEYLGEERIS